MLVLRYFYLVSFFLVIGAFIISGTYGRGYIESNILVPLIDRENHQAITLYDKIVWKKYLKQKQQCVDEYNQLIAQRRLELGRALVASEVPRIKCKASDNLQRFTKVFNDGMQNLEFNVYSDSGQLLANISGSTKEASALSELQKEGFSKAIKGKSSSILVEEYRVGNKTHHVVHAFYYLPKKLTLNQSGKKNITGIIEIITDITPYWSNPGKFQWFALIIIFIIFAIIFGSMYYTAKKTEQLISKQYEANVELTTAKASAEAENREKSQFLANVSHELRTPLNAIIGFSEIIKDEVMGPLNNQHYKEYIKDINLSGAHLLSLINDILDYSKAEAGKLKIEMTEIDLTKSIRNSVRLVVPRADEAGVEVITRLPNEHFIIFSDGKRIKQVILNLLSNSVKFTPNGGRIIVSCWEQKYQNEVAIRVEDTGVGIAPKDISKVMSTFGQVENKLSRKYEGTGLGLPLSNKLVSMMGGRMEIESEVGKGTAVTIFMPYSSSQKAGNHIRESITSTKISTEPNIQSMHPDDKNQIDPI